MSQSCSRTRGMPEWTCTFPATSRMSTESNTECRMLSAGQHVAEGELQVVFWVYFILQARWMMTVKLQLLRFACSLLCPSVCRRPAHTRSALMVKPEGLQIHLEMVGYKRIIPCFIVPPSLFSKLCIRPPIAVWILYVGLLLHSVQIFMQAIQQGS